MWQMSGGQVDLRGPGMHGLGFCSASTGEPWHKAGSDRVILDLEMLHLAAGGKTGQGPL